MASHGVDNNVSKKKNTFPFSQQSPFFRGRPVSESRKRQGALQKRRFSFTLFLRVPYPHLCAPLLNLTARSRHGSRTASAVCIPSPGGTFSLTEHSLRTCAASAVSALSSAAAFSLLTQLPRPSLLFQLAAERILSIPSLLPWLPTIRTHSRTW